jgi:anti-sigma regulatory factor (Ser/Thr protein kinase)
MGNKKVKHFAVENRIEELSSLAEKIEEFAGEFKLSPELTMKINLVMEEVLSNIIFYAFTDNNKHEISISVMLSGSRLTIEIKDDGIPFDPLTKDPPDITMPAEERPVGGLGIYMVSEIMDEMHYTRKKNQNILTLYKNMT